MDPHEVVPEGIERDHVRVVSGLLRESIRIRIVRFARSVYDVLI
jgi:hypothetical protein